MAQVLSFILVLFCHFGIVDLSGWITSLIAFLMAFVFLRSLDLGLSLRLTCINKRGIVAKFSLIISMVLNSFIFLSRPGALWVSGVNLPYSKKWLESSFSFCINNFLHYFFSQIQLISLIIYLYSDRRMWPFLDVSN